ncbi:MAG: SDR family oxidoreductase [Hyphomonadaceae bacterium]
MADHDEDALAALADDLGNAGLAPERVSTLAFDPTDAARWRQAMEFVQSQYGRIDWAILDAAPMPHSELVEFGRAVPPGLDGALLALRSVAPIVRQNTQGGAIVITATTPIEAGPLELAQFVRAAAQQGSVDKLRVNAVAAGGLAPAGDLAPPWFHELAQQAGSERAGFDRLSATPPALARLAPTGDIARSIVSLISDDAPVSGVTLIVDGAATL